MNCSIDLSLEEDGVLDAHLSAEANGFGDGEGFVVDALVEVDEVALARVANGFRQRGEYSAPSERPVRRSKGPQFLIRAEQLLLQRLAHGRHLRHDGHRVCSR
mgnify:CR=1 FL=1